MTVPPQFPAVLDGRDVAAPAEPTEGTHTAAMPATTAAASHRRLRIF
jgi:hypothetical protein